MRVSSVRVGEQSFAARHDADRTVALPATDVGELLQAIDNGTTTWSEIEAFDGEVLDSYALVPLIARPSKIVCVGLNYRPHILEMGRALPTAPTYFTKFADALIGAADDIVLDDVSTQWDWEAELAVVIGRTIRHASADEAASAIAGYTVANDITARDFQNRTTQWLAGKSFDRTCPLGPELVTSDAVRPHDGLRITCRVNDTTVQDTDTGDLVFDAVACVVDASSIFTLRPGDVILTGTPGGVGAGRVPPQYLRPGDVVVTDIEGIGRCTNRCVTGPK